MQIVRPRPLCYGVDTPFNIDLYSDTHLGAVGMDERLLKAELAASVADGARVNVNGDVFDAIVPADKRRYSPAALHRRLRGRADVMNAALDWAEEVFAPAAACIDMIGVGNHETELEKHGGVNMVTLLIDRLKKHNPEIRYGGYCGFLDYRFRPMVAGVAGRSGTGHRLVMFYHHGDRKRVPDSVFLNARSFVDADVVWVGDRHDRTTNGAVRLVCPKSGNNPKEKPVRFVMSGSYLHTYATGTRTYGEERMLKPQDRGRVRLIVTPNQHRLKVECLS